MASWVRSYRHLLQTTLCDGGTRLADAMVITAGMPIMFKAIPK